MDNNAIKLYFDYLFNDGKLTKLIKQSKDLTQQQLIILLLDDSKEYVLSDLQQINLITKYKKIAVFIIAAI